MQQRFRLCAFVVAAVSGAARADEVRDDFPVYAADWVFRVPKCGPTLSLTERDGFARIFNDSGATSGGYDNWSGADFAPTLERSDMGTGDWTISTRLEFVSPPPGAGYHAALFFAYGTHANNDLVYWGEYGFNGQLAVERVGNGIRPLYTVDPGPVSLQIQKEGNAYHFRHRATDDLEWVEDVVLANLNSPEPVMRVGVILKTYGGGAAPDAAADFDYFDLAVPDASLPADPNPEPIPQLSPLSGLICTKTPAGGLDLSWTVCDGAVSPIEVRVTGQLVDTLPGEATNAVIPPPLPGGSIINVEVKNGFDKSVTCTIVEPLLDLCDEFDEDPEGGGIWTLRTPKIAADGPKVTIEENLGYARFIVPSGAAAGGNFDNWTGADFAPSLERKDMGTLDWVISTRLEWNGPDGSPGTTHHVGLMVAFGEGPPIDAFNDVVYWGQYASPTSLRVERTGQALTPILPYPGAPVSLQMQKAGNTLIFSHRQDDADPWITDGTADIVLPFPPNAAASPPAGTPPSRVGLLIKTWGGGPEVIADFDYFCLRINDTPPEPKIDAAPAEGTVPLAVDFSAAGSVDPSGGTLTHAWDFGDGATTNGETAQHTYTKSGIIPVTLTSTDNDKNAGTATAEILASDDPAPYVFERLGTSGLGGIVKVDRSGAAPVHCIAAGGVEIGLSTDHGFFLYQKFPADFAVSAKITAGNFTSLRAKAGLMVRISADDRVPNVFMAVDGPNDGYTFQFRRAERGATTRALVTLPTPRAGLPAWVKLERQGNTFIGFYSTDGVAFTEYARETPAVLTAPELLVGFAAASGDSDLRADYCAQLSGFGAGPTVPSAPTGLVATAGAGSVSLNWNNNPEVDVTGYNVYRSNGGPFAKVNAAPVAASEYVDPGLTSGVAYCYKVSAIGGAGEGPQSTEACATPTGAEKTFRRGDADSSQTLDLTDPITILNYQFLGGPIPGCLDAADTDDTGTLDLTDAVYSLNFQFLAGPPPPAPGPAVCGRDPTDDVDRDLGCAVPCP